MKKRRPKIKRKNIPHGESWSDFAKRNRIDGTKFMSYQEYLDHLIVANEWGKESMRIPLYRDKHDSYLSLEANPNGRETIMLGYIALYDTMADPPMKEKPKEQGVRCDSCGLLASHCGRCGGKLTIYNKI